MASLAPSEGVASLAPSEGVASLALPSNRRGFFWPLLTGVATLTSRGGASVTYSRGVSLFSLFKKCGFFWFLLRGVATLASSRDAASSIGVTSSAPSEGVSFLDFFFRRGFDFS